MAVAGYDSEGIHTAARESDRRYCTICNMATVPGNRVPATWVAGNDDGFMWFECDDHGPGDHPSNPGPRTFKQPIAEFFNEVQERALAPTRALAHKATRARAALDELRQVAGPPGKGPKPVQDEPDIRKWPCPGNLAFERWRALLHRASGIRLNRSAEILGIPVPKLRKWLVDIMRTCEVTSQELEKTDIAHHWSEQTCPSIKAAHYAMTKVCDKHGLPIPYFED